MRVFIAILFCICITQAFGQFNRKEIDRLEKIGIHMAIYEQQVNEPDIVEILRLDRGHYKTLMPAVMLTSFSAVFFTLLATYDNGLPSVIAPLTAFGIVCAGGSIPLYTITFNKRYKRNKLIKRLSL